MTGSLHSQVSSTLNALALVYHCQCKPKNTKQNERVLMLCFLSCQLSVLFSTQLHTLCSKSFKMQNISVLSSRLSLPNNIIFPHQLASLYYHVYLTGYALFNIHDESNKLTFLGVTDLYMRNIVRINSSFRTLH